MDLDAYQAEARRTAPRSLDAYPAPIRHFVQGQECGEGSPAGDLLKLQDIHIWAHGLAGESGEVCDLLKKIHGHGKPYDRAALVKELGDVCWYLANLADAHGITLSEVAEENVRKLRARYPNGFTVAAAAAKRDEATPELLPDVPLLVEKITFPPRHSGHVDANGSPVECSCIGELG